MTTTRPGIITPERFEDLITLLATIFCIFLAGMVVGIQLEKKLGDKVPISAVPIIQGRHLP